jgi:hypothetical protein
MTVRAGACCCEVVAAVSMAVPSSVIPLEALVGQLALHMVATADQISARLGFRREGERGVGRSLYAGSTGGGL